MPMTAAEIAAAQRLKNRSESGALPFPEYQFLPFPVELVRAFPAMAEWIKKENARLADHAKKQNTVNAANTR